MKIAYLVHNLNDPAVERRCRMLTAGGAQVRLAGFCRDAQLRAAIAAYHPLLLGSSADAAFVQRAAATVHNALFSRRLSAFFADADVLIARNLEQLAIARAIVGKRPLVYECLDIHRSLTGTGRMAKLVRWTEAMLLPRVNLLITSSPAFLREHFENRPLQARSLLVENKLLVTGSAVPPRPDHSRLPPHPLRIGWFGMLRCKQTLSFLQDLVTRADGRIEVLVSGKPSPAELPDLAQRIAATPHMHYAGPYTYDELPALYAQCHFAWTIDWFEEGLNSSWLLPNRMYEALAFGTVPIALARIEVGRWLQHHDAGLLVDTPEQLIDRLLQMPDAELADLLQKAAAVPREALIADEADCRQLAQDIESLVK
ncbi:hypothetical protein RM533_00590 [Croceicoccus sp. F390]|uniref:Glycosyl transferase family 1 n=1 Tax=Croceicoccus esteveae TaxID=3075597 RepID=A0ABU2ZDJ6_9SPHN|nr:hypothetical protein [Croceicoccus sp. F390]MDT0574674.1 hypothetical protein [Croceicoccus sp. F390]